MGTAYRACRTCGNRAGAGEMALPQVRSGDPLLMDPPDAHVEPDVPGPRRRDLVVPSPLQQLAIPAAVAVRERSAGLIVRPAQRIPCSRHQNVRHSLEPKTSAQSRLLDQPRTPGVHQIPSTNPEVLDTSFGRTVPSRGFGRLRNGRLCDGRHDWCWWAICGFPRRRVPEHRPATRRPAGRRRRPVRGTLRWIGKRVMSWLDAGAV